MPVEPVWSIDFPTAHEAFLFERQVKGWSRAKKEVLMRGDWQGIHEIVKRERQERSKKDHPSTPLRSAQDAKRK